MDLPPSTYHLQSLNQVLEFSKTDASLDDSHPIRELDADGDLLVDVGHPVSGILEGMSDRTMHLALLTQLFSFGLDFRLFFSGNSSHCYRIDLLMHLPVPFVESREIRSSSARLPKQELRAFRSARTCSLCLQRTPLSRCSSEDHRPGTNAPALLACYQPDARTKGSRNLLNCIPFVAFLKPAPLGFVAYSSLRVLRKVSFSHFIHKTSKLTVYYNHINVMLRLTFRHYNPKSLENQS